MNKIMKGNPFIPGSIIFGGLLIAVGVYMSGGGNVPHEGRDALLGTQILEVAERRENPHIFGNPDAPITVVEFSDFECPFCARLHPTLEQVISESSDGVKWEYRHLPLPSHRNAEAAAYAAECVARLAGNDAFWKFTDIALKNQRALNTAFFEREASRLDISLEEFRSCVSSDEVARIVKKDVDTAVAFGGRGTPFSVIVYADGTTRPVSGALPIAQWKSLLNQ